MRLASCRNGSRDGVLVVVDPAARRCLPVPGIARSLQAALDDWDAAAPRLAAAARALAESDPAEAWPFDAADCLAPLPRAFCFADGSAYLSHAELLRRARGAALPARFRIEPLMYQALSDGFLGPCDPIPLADPDWGLDFEAEIAVVLDSVPQGAAPQAAGGRVRLLVLLNDVTLRNLVPDELGKGFGFFHSKPASAFAPLAVTPDELGTAWDGARLHLPVRCTVNGRLVGRPDAGRDMDFDFPQLIAHAARTRDLGPGSLVGGGTVANRDPEAGAACLAEIRACETLACGAARTPFLKPGDRLRLEVLDAAGRSVFGAIDQEVVAG